MTDTTPLGLFVVTFLFVSLTPGLCMTLSLTLGIAIGVRRTLWMMAGELVGVGVIFTAAVLGVAAFMLDYPQAFKVLSYVGGAYLVYVGWRMWNAPEGNLQVNQALSRNSFTPGALALQGFLTAVANPKGWAFALALLPPFFDYSAPMTPQLVLLIGIASFGVNFARGYSTSAGAAVSTPLVDTSCARTLVRSPKLLNRAKMSSCSSV